MRKEKSAGAIVFRIENTKPKYLLLHYPSSANAKKEYWDLPKGHVEEGETEEETARREVKEETGLEAKHYTPIVQMDLSNSVSDEEAIQMARKLCKEEAIFGGISAGANIFAALKIAEKIDKKAKILTFIPDSGQRYLTCEVYDF